MGTSGSMRALQLPRGERPFDVVVFGCTGNAGRATALQLLRHTPAELRSRVALAGRNRQKVEQLMAGVCSELGLSPSSESDPGIIVADASDAASMLEMTRATRVLISCAGPFGRYGESSVVACIESRTHYLDITGEVPWVNRMSNEHGAAAEKNRVVLLPFSGYDCIPAELCMQLASSALGQRGSNMEQFNLVCRGEGGGMPHGTMETLLDKLEGKDTKPEAGDTKFFPVEFKSKVKAALSPVSLITPYWSSHMKQITGPNFMAAVNVPVLSNSAATLGLQPFSITDRVSIVKTPSASTLWGLIPTLVYTATLLGFAFLSTIPYFRSWLRARLQTYSFGGDPNGKVVFDAQAVSANSHSSASVNLQCPGDPGIYATGLFATSVALALLKAIDPDSSYQPPRAGFNPPVAALNDNDGLLLRQLTACGVEVTVKA